MWHNKEKRHKRRVVSLVAKFIDNDFYLSTYTDVASETADAAKHYVEFGCKEGRDPTPTFSTSGYLSRYPDVAQAGINPFYHYLVHGRFENRVTLPVTVSHPNEAVQGPAKLPQIVPLENVESLGLELRDPSRVERMLGVSPGMLLARRVDPDTTFILSAVGEVEEVEGHPPALTQVLKPDYALAESIVDAAKGKTLSLDMWDTIIRRKCAPDTIKLRHARLQWLSDIDRGGPLGALGPIDLLQVRRIVEADLADDAFEYRLADVANKLAHVFQVADASYPERFLQREESLERRSVYLDPTMAEVLRRHQGRRIVVSDFYMNGRALQGLLNHAGVTSIHHVYASSDHMKTKRAGDLYEFVLSREQVPASDIVHVGDRFVTDVTTAQQHGLQAMHFLPEEASEIAEALDRDFWAYLGGDTARYPTRLLQSLAEIHPTMKDLAPLSIAVAMFVLNVAETAMRHKVDKIFFFTREGDFFRRIYDVLVKNDALEIGTYPEPVTIAVSRRATFAASLPDFTVDSLMLLWTQYSSQSVRALATTLNIDISLWERRAAAFDLDVDEIVHMPWADKRFTRFISDPAVRKIGRNAIVEQRAALLEYLECAGFDPYDNVHRVVVDIGWRGTIQDNLSRLTKGTLHGCYFGLEGYLNAQSDRVTKSGYVFDVNAGRPLRVPEVAGLEFMFNAPGGSTIGYKSGEPLREIIPSEEDVVLGPVAALQREMIELSADVAAFTRDRGLTSGDLAPFVREIVQDFANRPPGRVAQAFFELSHNESFGVGAVHSMVFDQARIGELRDLRGAELHGRATKLLSDVRWPAAVYQLPSFRTLEGQLSPSQRLELPGAPALIRASSLGRPRVAVLSPAPICGSGGHRTIFNLSRALALRGFDVHLMHEHPADQETDAWIGGILQDAPITQYNGWVNFIRPAASVATIWYSAGYAAEFWDDIEARNYFVQDYEALFNPVGDAFIRASQSYAWGSNHICVGRWLAHVLRRQFGVGVASGGLGVDHQTYKPLPNVQRDPTQIALLYQPEKFRRAPELCIAALSLVKKLVPEAKIVVYGSDLRPHLPFEFEHRGLITDIREINVLYNESATGLCISTTNPSRIPFEMMAAGCVPVDVYRYNNLFDYDSGTALLAHESPEAVASAVVKLLTDKQDCSVRRTAGQRSMANRSLGWEMDVAVNAVESGLRGLDFTTLDVVHPTYLDAPVISAERTASADDSYVKFQWELATSL